MKNPIKTLFEEHSIITSAINISRQADKLIAKNDDVYEKLVRDLINFFRVYADQYHHYKEEHILFPEMSKKSDLLKDGIVNEMMDNHADFREMIKTTEDYLNKQDFIRAQQQLHVYSEFLLDHIAVENEEMFQMAESMFSEDELEKIYFRFEDCDREVGEQQKIALVNQLQDMRRVLI
ncbi:MAG TPA: hemerythrin domain-containing protein [Bacteroidia bacterium]